jgi:hypothetical protein
MSVEDPDAPGSGQASVRNLPAPRAEFVEPFRRRVAAITGADNGVESTASSAFKPCLA